jgi:hypothetical protein
LDYEPEYVKKVAAQLWRLLSELVGTRVCKGNLRSILESYRRSFTITDWGEAIDVLRFYGRQTELDNVESILQQGDARCNYLSGYEAYGEMFDQISAERHQSCIILTGREKPHGIVQREGVNLPVRSIAAAQHILIDKGLECPPLDRVNTR